MIFPQPQYRLSGPNGVEASFDAKSSATGLAQAMTATLVNDVSSYS